MSLLVIISVLVQLYCLIINTKAVDVPESVLLNITSNHQNFNTTENVNLKLRITAQTEGILEGECEGTCLVNTNVKKPFESCEVISDENIKYIDVTMSGILSKNDSGDWTCPVQYVKHVNQNGSQQNEKRSETYSFQLNVEEESGPFVRDWTYIIVGISILVLLIIIGQTICIIHFKRKAYAVKKQAEWTSRKELPEDNVRYSKMPVQKASIDLGQKASIDLGQEARESGIYEALENKVPPKPQPPPLQTLPRKAASHSMAPVSTTELVADKASTSQRSFTNGMMLPFNSLRKNKKVPTETDSNTSTLDRIKERPPLPIPADEIYEDMENSSAPPTKEIKNVVPKQGARKKELPVKDIQKHEEFRGFNTQPRLTPVPAAAVTTGGGNQTLNPQELSSQLKQAIHLRKRAIDVMQESPRPKELTPKVTPFNPGLPPPAASPSRLASPFSRPEKPTPKHPVAPKHKPPAPAKPKQLHPLPPTPIEPAAPAKPKQLHPWPPTSTEPATPAKPRQLHPWPPIPAEPEPIPVITQGDDENDWHEDWTYEPLPNYNIYSI